MHFKKILLCKSFQCAMEKIVLSKWKWQSFLTNFKFQVTTTITISHKNPKPLHMIRRCALCFSENLAMSYEVNIQTEGFVDKSLSTQDWCSLTDFFSTTMPFLLNRLKDLGNKNWHFWRRKKLKLTVLLQIYFMIWVIHKPCEPCRLLDDNCSAKYTN